VLVILMSILVLGSYMTANDFYATYTLAKKINIGNFLQRLEVILVISYLTSTFSSVRLRCISFAGACSSFSVFGNIGRLLLQCS
jgi:spore germination protein KB